MARLLRTRKTWLIVLALLAATTGVIVSLLVLAGPNDVTLTATLYSDVIRFEAEGVASLRVTIYDLSENQLWSSGQVMGDFVDWDRTNERGERLANGYYLYLAQGWDVSDRLVLNKEGKVVLLPGTQVELKAAPVPLLPATEEGGTVQVDNDLSPMAEIVDDHLVVHGNIYLRNRVDQSGTNPGFYFRETDQTHPAGYFTFQVNGDTMRYVGRNDTDTGWNYLMTYTRDGNVGVATTDVTDRLTIQGTNGNLIACYPSDSRVAGAAVFRVESDGDVYADGTVYSQTTAVGQADVAERINVSEWVEAGDVVEIDPFHPGFFRKATEQYSRRVAGIISTSPGVILGNDADDVNGEWNDNRPVLAIAGRVPIKASAENGAIVIGDLLVSSSIPGVAMKGDPAISIGSVIGKAMEPLNGGEGVIMAQVMLR